MSGEATPAQIAGVRRRAARQGRDGRRGRRARAARCSRTRSASTSPGPVVDIVGTGGDRRAHRQHLDDGGARGRRRRRPGGQARQPRGVLVVRRRPTCSRSSASPLDLPPAQVAERGRRGRHHLLLRAGRSTRRCATPGRSARELGVPTVVQLPRPAGQPGPAARAGGRRAPTRGWRPSWPGCFAGRGASALVFRGDDGLDELTTTTTSQVWVVRGRRGAPARCVDPRGAGHRRRRGPRTCAAATRAFNAEVVPRPARRRAGPGARRRAAQRRRRAGRPRRGRRVPLERPARRGAWRALPRPSTPGAAAASASTAGSRDRRVSGLARGAALHRRLSESSQAERERRLEVVPGVGAERDVRLGRARRRPC